MTDHWDDYLIEETDVLKNTLGITNKEELHEKEKAITRKSLAKIYLKPVCKTFDDKDLKNLHKEIFKDIYPFAGELRLCPLGKNHTMFCEPTQIENKLNETLDKLNNIPDINSVYELAFFIAPIYHELIMVHPFREGNGRTIRVFFREFVLEKSKNLSCGPQDIDYTKMDSQNLFLGTAFRNVYSNLLEAEFSKAITPVQKENDYQK